MVKLTTATELQKEFIRLGVKPNGAELKTTRELAKAWGMGVQAVISRLHMAQEAGILVVGKKQITSLSGAMTTKPAYRIKMKGAK